MRLPKKEKVCAKDSMTPLVTYGGVLRVRVLAYWRAAGKIGTFAKPPNIAKQQVIQKFPIGRTNRPATKTRKRAQQIKRTVKINFLVRSMKAPAT